MAPRPLLWGLFVLSECEGAGSVVKATGAVFVDGWGSVIKVLLLLSCGAKVMDNLIDFVDGEAPVILVAV